MKKRLPISQTGRKLNLMHHMPMPPLREAFLTKIIILTDHTLETRTTYRLLLPTIITKISIMNVLVINSNRIQWTPHWFSYNWTPILNNLIVRRLWSIRLFIFQFILHYKGEKFHNITFFSYLTFAFTSNTKTNLVGFADRTRKIMYILHLLRLI